MVTPRFVLVLLLIGQSQAVNVFSPVSSVIETGFIPPVNISAATINGRNLPECSSMDAYVCYASIDVWNVIFALADKAKTSAVTFTGGSTPIPPIEIKYLTETEHTFKVQLDYKPTQMVLMNSEGQTVGSPVDPTNDKESCPATPSKDCFKVDNGVNYVMVTGIAESGPLVVKLTAGGKSMTATINAAAWTSGSSAIVLANLALLFFFH